MELKKVARRLDVPVMTLCQINREGAKPERPRLVDLKGSGQIEQDADIVLILHRPGKDSDTIELEIAKNRNGRRGEILPFRYTSNRFRVEPILENGVVDWIPPTERNEATSEF